MTSNGKNYDIFIGILQGNLLGTLLFSLELQPTPNHMSFDSFKFYFYFFFYVNDIYLFGKYDQLVHFLSHLTTHLFEAPRFSINQ